MQQLFSRPRFQSLALAASACAVLLFAGDVLAQTQLVEYAKLSLKGGRANDAFGQAVAIDGNTMVVGMVGPIDSVGNAFVYVRNANGAWALQASLGGPAANSRFGSCVGVSGDTVLVGSPGSTEEAAYIYTRNGAAWTQQAILSVGAKAGFAQYCDLHGDSAMVSAANGSTGGGVYIFTRSASSWTQQTRLTAINPSAGDGFGGALTIEGNTAVVGVPGDSGGSKGSVHVFVRNGTSWTGQQKLIASDGLSGDLLGLSVAIHGDTIVAGAPNNGAGNFSGAAYVFTRSGTVWTQQQKLVTSDGISRAYVGSSVAVENDTAIIGSVRDHHEGGSGGGSAFVFQRSANNWTQTQKIVPADIHPGDHFSTSMDISNRVAVISSGGDSIGSNSSAGSATLFVTNPTGCTYALSLTKTSLLAAAGATGSFTVSTQPGCQWHATVQDDVAWLATTDAATGSGAVNFTAVANTGVARRSQIKINGLQAFWINQASTLNVKAGDLDVGFGNVGFATASLRNFNQANGIAVQPDGKIIVVGQSYGSGLSTLATVLRYNADGTLDTRFDGDGIAAFAATPVDFNPGFSAVVVQPDGKVVAAGNVTRSSGNTDYLVVRFNPDGALDTEFGSGGVVRTDLGSSADLAGSIALLSDGKIVVSGVVDYAYFGVVRYNANGSLDNSFDGDGISLLPGAPSLRRGMAVQPDGKIVVIGLSLVARFNTDGSLDTSFDVDGMASPGGYTVAMQPDGKIVIGTGRNDPGGKLDFAISRLNSNGSIDTSFGSNGLVQTDIGLSPIDEPYTQDVLKDIVVQPNGQILAIGTAQSNRVTGDVWINAATVRYNANGSIDTGFGNDNGIAMTDFPFYDVYDVPQAVAVQPDGKIVMAGVYTAISNRLDFLVMRRYGAAALAVTDTSVNADTVFAWAEKTYGQVFAANGQPSQTTAGYHYRVYGGAHYLAVNGSGEAHLYYLGPLSNNAVLDLGLLAGWLSQATP